MARPISGLQPVSLAQPSEPLRRALPGVHTPVPRPLRLPRDAFSAGRDHGDAFMSFRYAVLGSGRQGTAAAFDMGRFGEADVIWLLDSDLAQAEKATSRVNDLLGRRP